MLGGVRIVLNKFGVRKSTETNMEISGSEQKITDSINTITIQENTLIMFLTENPEAFPAPISTD